MQGPLSLKNKMLSTPLLNLNKTSTPIRTRVINSNTHINSTPINQLKSNPSSSKFTTFDQTRLNRLLHKNQQNNDNNTNIDDDGINKENQNLTNHLHNKYQESQQKINNLLKQSRSYQKDINILKSSKNQSGTKFGKYQYVTRKSPPRQSKINNMNLNNTNTIQQISRPMNYSPILALNRKNPTIYNSSTREYRSFTPNARIERKQLTVSPSNSYYGQKNGEQNQTQSKSMILEQQKEKSFVKQNIDSSNMRNSKMKDSLMRTSNSFSNLLQSRGQSLGQRQRLGSMAFASMSKRNLLEAQNKHLQSTNRANFKKSFRESLSQQNFKSYNDKNSNKFYHQITQLNNPNTSLQFNKFAQFNYLKKSKKSKENLLGSMQFGFNNNNNNNKDSTSKALINSKNFNNCDQDLYCSNGKTINQSGGCFSAFYSPRNQKNNIKQHIQFRNNGSKQLNDGVLWCMNNHNKRAKYQVVQKNHMLHQNNYVNGNDELDDQIIVYCSKCAIQLVQKGFSVVQLDTQITSNLLGSSRGNLTNPISQLDRYQSAKVSLVHSPQQKFNNSQRNLSFITISSTNKKFHNLSNQNQSNTDNSSSLNKQYINYALQLKQKLSNKMDQIFNIQKQITQKYHNQMEQLDCYYNSLISYIQTQRQKDKKKIQEFKYEVIKMYQSQRGQIGDDQMMMKQKIQQMIQKLEYFIKTKHVNQAVVRELTDIQNYLGQQTHLHDFRTISNQCYLPLDHLILIDQPIQDQFDNFVSYFDNQLKLKYRLANQPPKTYPNQKTFSNPKNNTNVVQNALRFSFQKALKQKKHKKNILSTFMMNPLQEQQDQDEQFDEQLLRQQQCVKNLNNNNNNNDRQTIFQSSKNNDCFVCDQNSFSQYNSCNDGGNQFIDQQLQKGQSQQCKEDHLESRESFQNYIQNQNQNNFYINNNNNNNNLTQSNFERISHPDQLNQNQKPFRTLFADQDDYDDLVNLGEQDRDIKGNFQENYKGIKIGQKKNDIYSPTFKSI